MSTRFSDFYNRFSINTTPNMYGGNNLVNLWLQPVLKHHTAKIQIDSTIPCV